MNMVRSMMLEKKIPKEFWPEAVNWYVYVQNRSPTIVVKDITPEEAWSGIKPSVHFFRVFGCIGYVHIPDAHIKKLDNKSTKCILLGVSEESKAYRLYDPISKKVIVSRDVVFDESEMWNWNTNNDVSEGLVDMGEKEEVEIQESEHTPPVENDLNINTQCNNEEDMNAPNGSDATEQQLDNNGSDITEQQLDKRNRRPPEWLTDYDGNED